MVSVAQHTQGFSGQFQENKNWNSSGPQCPNAMFLRNSNGAGPGHPGDSGMLYYSANTPIQSYPFVQGHHNYPANIGRSRNEAILGQPRSNNRVARGGQSCPATSLSQSQSPGQFIGQPQGENLGDYRVEPRGQISSQQSQGQNRGSTRGRRQSRRQTRQNQPRSQPQGNYCGPLRGSQNQYRPQNGRFNPLGQRLLGNPGVRATGARGPRRLPRRYNTCAVDYKMSDAPDVQSVEVVQLMHYQQELQPQFHQDADHDTVMEDAPPLPEDPQIDYLARLLANVGLANQQQANMYHG